MMNDDFLIRKAKHGEAQRLTEISFASKRYWQYPDTYFLIWRPELTITEDYLDKSEVYLVEIDGFIFGYYSLVTLFDNVKILGQQLEKGLWLEHMFILPEYIGSGFGRILFSHLCTTGTEQAYFHLLADPCARGFYEKMGCLYIREFPSTIEGRTTPLMRKDLCRMVTD